MTLKREDSRWWALCILFKNTPRKFREKLSYATTASRIRIAKLDPAIGGQLDGLDDPPPLRIYRFIAWADGPCAQEQRLTLALALRAAMGRWPTDGRLGAEMRAIDRGPTSRPTIACSRGKRVPRAVMPEVTAFVRCASTWPPPRTEAEPCKVPE